MNGRRSGGQWRREGGANLERTASLVWITIDDEAHLHPAHYRGQLQQVPRLALKGVSRDGDITAVIPQTGVVVKDEHTSGVQLIPTLRGQTFLSNTLVHHSEH